MKIKNVQAEMERVMSDTPDISRFDLTERVFRAQLHGSMMGMRLGVRPTQFREDRRKGSQRSNRTLMEENQQLWGEVSSLRTNQERIELEVHESRRRGEEEAARRDQEAEENRRQIAFIMAQLQ